MAQRAVPTGSRLGYRPALDGVRALAILGVVWLHASGWGALPAVLPGGHLGVTVFFVLSGYLITTLLRAEQDRTGRIDLRGFYLRRAARLMPALLLLLVFHTLFWWPRKGGYEMAATVLPALFYLSSIVQGFWSKMGTITWSWSLSVEEHFYLLWPPLLCWLRTGRRLPWRRNRAPGGTRRRQLGRRVAGALRHPDVAAAATAVLLIATATALRIWLTHSVRWHDFLYYSTFTRMDALAVGCLLALFLRRYRLPAAGALGWLGLAVLGVCYADPQLGIGWSALSVWGLPVAGAAAAVLIGSVVQRPDSRLARLLSVRPLVRIGVVSYGLYLWNLLPGTAIKAVLGHDLGALGTVWALVLAYVAVELSYRLVERPVLAWAKARMRGESTDTVTVTELRTTLRLTATELTRSDAVRSLTVPALIR